jgi:histidinol dehydrogenase
MSPRRPPNDDDPYGPLTLVDVRGSGANLEGVLPAPKVVDDEEANATVRQILAQVRQAGDAALVELTARFDGVEIDELRVSPDEVKAALDQIPPSLKDALELAYDNIVRYHRSQVHPDRQVEHEGVLVEDVRRPVDRAGLYVPGGRAPLASTVLMTAGPARVAGVPQTVMCSPPGPDGRIAASVLAAAAVAGVDEVYRIGGAQAIAAMAYGTQTVDRVDVIVGPGNRYVAIAERAVAGEGAVGVPSAFTGPSEVAVVADDSTEPAYAAIDLLVQAEHGPDGLAYLITWSESAARRIAAEVARLVEESPRRREIESTMSEGGFCVLVDGPEQAMDVVNVLAPEHLELMTANRRELVARVRSAGAVFLGPWSPASVGDYIAGPNHVLPTARSARFGSALRVDDFCKQIHVVEVSREALLRLAPHVQAMADSEGLPAHAASVSIRASS